MERVGARVPALAWVYGGAGLIPFVGSAAADIAGAAPGHAWWRVALLAYSAVILSFLGGGRWGLELARTSPRNGVISGAMLPSIAAFFLVITPETYRNWALGAVALAHILQCLWDVRSSDAPPGYAPLRVCLTSVAVLSIVADLAFG